MASTDTLGGPSLVAPALKGPVVSDFGWPLPWYQIVEESFADIDPEVAGEVAGGRTPGRMPIIVWKTVAPRTGLEWISGAVIAAGVGLVAWGAWPRRRAGAES